MSRNLLVKRESLSGKFQLTWKRFCRWSMLVGPSHTLLQRGEREAEGKKKNLYWSTFTLCGLSGLLLPLSWTWIITAMCWSYHKVCPCGPFTYLKMSWPVIHGASPPTQPTFADVSPLSPLQIPCVLTKLPSSLDLTRAVCSSPLGLILSCALRGKCALSLSFLPLIFSEFLLCASTETPFPHLQTLPNQAKCVREVLPLHSQLEMFFLPLYIQGRSP